MLSTKSTRQRSKTRKILTRHPAQRYIPFSIIVQQQHFGESLNEEHRIKEFIS